jgi:hypothetical protein
MASNFILWIVLACLVLFVLMLAAARLGQRVAARVPVSPESAASIGVQVTAIFALFGLLVAFTFSAAFARLDARRALIVAEANAIGTAYLRLDLLPAEAQPGLRDEFRRYALVRARFSDALAEPDVARELMTQTEALQRRIWADAVAATAGAAQNMRLLVIPALNEMIDLTTTRLVAVQTHSPLLVFGTLFGLAVACAALASFAGGPSGRVGRIHLIVFAAVATFTLYVILDVEFPSRGFVQLGYYNQVMHDLAESIQR